MGGGEDRATRELVGEPDSPLPRVDAGRAGRFYRLEEARSEALRDSLVGDLQMIDDIHAAAANGVDMNAYIQERGLDQAQATVLQTYFGGEKDKPRDAVAAVAAGMRMRIRMTRKPGIIEYMKSEVMKKPDSEWRQLGRIGNAEKPPFNVVALASDLFHAMDQWGTDEDKIFAALAGLTPVQSKAIRAHYQIRYHRSLDEHLESEMSDAELTRAQACCRATRSWPMSRLCTKRCMAG